MKRKIILFAIITLFVMIGAVACKKDVQNIATIKQKIIGKWEWIVSYGGVVGESRPKQGEKQVMTITTDSILQTRSDIILRESYIITQENDDFFITTRSKNPTTNETNVVKSEISLNATYDTLGFSISTGTANFTSLYKKISD